MGWTEIKTKDDIANLMNIYGGFHDTCIVKISYNSGNYVANDKTMHFENNNSILILFHSQWYDTPLELCFTGVRRMNLVGIQDNYTSELYDCYLELHDRILPYKYTGHKELIIWADGSNFDINELRNIDLTTEPLHTFIISTHLKWRLKDIQSDN